MSGVRVLVGTSKGAFVLTSDGHRDTWEVSGPLFGGWEVYHVAGSPAEPNRLFASQSNGWFGQIVQRSDDGGATWEPVGNDFSYVGDLSWGFMPEPEAEVGHCVHTLARHPSRPDVVFMQKHWDVMRSDDGGMSWREISGDLPTDFGFTNDVHAHEPDTVYVVPITSDEQHYPPDGRLRVTPAVAGQ
jgi:hypothetical protein